MNKPKEMLIAVLLLVIFVLMMWIGYAHGATVICRETAGSGGGWSWRSVDGKRCWYRGPKNISKATLRWDMRTPSQRDEERVLLEGVWPPLSRE